MKKYEYPNIEIKDFNNEMITASGNSTNEAVNKWAASRPDKKPTVKSLNYKDLEGFME